ncbi:hypothetical protein H0H87_009271 [Tephrocybe sp. NHM501043]|nr:hypothetical protein H0H87_009271 [Tephrocybe sp. NHM501043]
MYVFRCLRHVVNLGTVDVMLHITNVGNMETATAIWEFDPALKDNCVLGGSLDVVSAIHTLTIKTQKKGQIVKHIEWAAFKLIDEDWACVGNTRDILADANNIQQVFSSDKHPTLWHALPVLK